MAYLGISRRAARDIEEIRSFSSEHWGSKTAEEYLTKLEPALLEESDLLHKTFLTRIRKRPAGPAS